jgi:hypothetical protein
MSASRESPRTLIEGMVGERNGFRSGARQVRLHHAFAGSASSELRWLTVVTTIGPRRERTGGCDVSPEPSGPASFASDLHYA